MATVAMVIGAIISNVLPSPFSVAFITTKNAHAPMAIGRTAKSARLVRRLLPIVVVVCCVVGVGAIGVGVGVLNPSNCQSSLEFQSGPSWHCAACRLTIQTTVITNNVRISHLFIMLRHLQ